jgi:DNA (cytosine-5)-methyltransferase 1
MNPISKIAVVDLFCGTGALSYGLSARNPAFTTVAGIDLDRPASETAAANHRTAKIICERIENFSPQTLTSQANLSEVDLIVGGPPCQGFSSLRPSRGQDLDDPRNNLYKQFIKYVATLRPAAFLMENVIGLVNAGEGRLLRDIISGFERVGYRVDWRILNAANFGVPQKRERFFLIGVKKSASNTVPIEFPEPTHSFSGKVIGTRYKSNYLVNPRNGHPAIGVWDAISDLPSISSGQSSEVYRSRPQNSYQLARRVRAGKALSLHEAANHSAKMLEVIRHSGASINAIPKGLITSGYSSCYSRLDPDEPSTTITVKFTSPASSKCIHPKDDRAITPREAARIQGFDDDFVFCGSKTDIASQIGNAVPPIFGGVFSNVFERILDSRISVEEY